MRLSKLRAYGWSAEQRHDAQRALRLRQRAGQVGMMYTNAFGRFSVADNLCGMSLAPSSTLPATPMPTSAAAKALELRHRQRHGQRRADGRVSKRGL